MPCNAGPAKRRRCHSHRALPHDLPPQGTMKDHPAPKLRRRHPRRPALLRASSCRSHLVRQSPTPTIPCATRLLPSSRWFREPPTPTLPCKGGGRFPRSLPFHSQWFREPPTPTLPRKGGGRFPSTLPPKGGGTF